MSRLELGLVFLGTMASKCQALHQKMKVADDEPEVVTVSVVEVCTAVAVESRNRTDRVGSERSMSVDMGCLRLPKEGQRRG